MRSEVRLEGLARSVDAGARTAAAQAREASGGLEVVREALLGRESLVRGLASGRRRGVDGPPYLRVELRYVDLKGVRHLQITEFDDRQAHTRNVAAAELEQAVDELLGQAYGSWHVETTTETLRLRYTKKGKELLHRQDDDREQETRHDRVKRRVLDPAAPFLIELGISDHQGRVKPSRQAKYKQIEEFCKLLAPALDEAIAAGRIAAGRPLQVVDLGCGNAYLTLAAYHLLTAAGHDVRMTGIDHNPGARKRNTRVVEALGWQDHLRFVDATIQAAELDVRPDVVLALHACDTATDDALARAVGWQASLVLAAPCCHHDIQTQLKSVTPPAPYALMTRYGIVRERFADVLTDSLRAAVLRQVGYRVEVVQFVDSQHTPRNLLLRAARTGAKPTPDLQSEYQTLIAEWQVNPRLAQLLLPPTPTPAGTPTEPADLAEPTHPAASANLTEPAHPAESAHSAEPAHPAASEPGGASAQPGVSRPGGVVS
ncbi:SAM-dependent methyltransferase [Kribbella solani]|uniref:class I SAM-dependent methyltransferase n=1 Tax=Kribbella solani TaxID=236067 RepID=UPI0029A0041D|nr:SAM-dependent methyltransferase [Kribbella solani]MDX3006858.1 SAM-dependent methyltransferase [Kribbella solani]